jgi:hypothetical protein
MKRITTLEWLLGRELPNGNGHHERQAVQVPTITLKPQKDRAGTWLKAAGVSLAGLAAAAATVSYFAQFTVIQHVKHDKIVSFVQAGIPDIGALVFACLGIALALHGKRAIRARFCNVGCVGLSIAMNALAAVMGWRPMFVWVMAPVLYAVASDTLIGVLRAYYIARQKALHQTLSSDDSTPLQVIGAVLLWILRLMMAPRDTLKGFRAWVLSTPTSPKPRPVVVRPTKAIPPRAPKVTGPREGSKTQRMVRAAAEEADLKTIPLNRVSELATRKAAEIGLDGGSARAALAKHVRQLQGITGGKSRA